jgi:hypothetical protein
MATIIKLHILVPKTLIKERHRVPVLVLLLLLLPLQALLLSMPDGYLCREQGGVLKYMLAFKEAARAAEWCLMMSVRTTSGVFRRSTTWLSMFLYC